MMDLSHYADYSAYQDGMAPWLGKVPKEWNFTKAKWHLKHQKRLNFDGKSDNVLSLTLRGVVNNDPDNPEGLIPKDYRTYQVFETDDLVFKLIDLENVRTSRVGLVHEQGIMSSAYIRLVQPTGWNPRFLYYYYFHLYQAEVFNKIGSGVRSTLGQSDLLDLPIPVLSSETQSAIAAFLDDKCAKIDGAVKIKEDQIALLRERRQIIIQDAVTRGLNPATTMKDSGIDWIGQIPAHWEVKRNKHMFVEINQRSAKGTEQHLSMSQKLGLVPANLVEKSLVSDSYEGAKLVQPGDLVLNRLKAHLAVFSIAQMEGLVSPDYSVFRPFVNGASSQYYEALFKTSIFLGEFRLRVRGIVEGFYRLYTDSFMDIPLLIPPQPEQAEIVAHLDQLAVKFEAAISIKQDQIAAIKEYKTSLINAAVTGKIKVI